MPKMPQPDNTRCPYPKHSGKTWIEIAEEDRAYLEWLISKDGPPMTDERYDAIVEALEDTP